MKLKIKKDILLEGLNKVSKALSTKNLVPVLAGIKFDLNSNGLILTASDNDISIQYYINNLEDMNIEKEGSIIIQGKLILEIIRKLPSEFINIEVIDELKILVSTETSEFILNGISKNEYPNIILEESRTPLILDNKVFKSLIFQTFFASSNDESRPVLTGLNFKITKDYLECNATDSYRLAHKVIKLENNNINEEYNIVIPSKNIFEFTKLIGENDFEVELHIFNNKILFKHNNMLFQSRLINGSYPNTSNLMPNDFILGVNVNINNLYNIIDRVGVLSSDKEKNIITFEINNNILTVKSSCDGIGRSEEKVEITKDSEQNIKISFVAKYMLEALKSFNTENATINFVGEIKPIILKSSEQEGLVQLVLPIRTY